MPDANQKNDRLEKLRNSKNYCGLVIELGESDHRMEKHLDQIDERGFDNTELWNLDLSLVKFMTPRLIAYRQYESDAVILENLNFIIEMFTKRMEDDSYYYNPIFQDKMRKSYKLLADILPNLWL